MIAFVEGRLLGHDGESVIVLVNGLGLRVQVYSDMLNRLPSAGATVSFYTHLVVKEDAFELYGFANEAERETFLKLLGVGGVGPRLALAVVGCLGTQRFWSAVLQEDAVTLATVPGIGKKTAQRMIVELKDRAERLAFTVSEAMDEAAGGMDDALAALTSLGYTAREAAEALTVAKKGVAKGPGVAELVTAALKVLGRNRC